ncbi:MAG: diguanylate cyclase [Leptolyngbyaceae cyanobacterium bins.302]|nr:diguanylate cyclase [Leptolyngbyaceae cyanobacterium bins.302]
MRQRLARLIANQLTLLKVHNQPSKNLFQQPAGDRSIFIVENNSSRQPSEQPDDELSREDQLLEKIADLQREVDRLKQANQDLYLSLTTTAEHGDIIEAELQRTNQQLLTEVEERKRAQATLKALVAAISKRKDDLEIVVQTIMEHGDVMDTQWSQKLSEITKIASLDALTQIANRRRFDEHLEYQWRQMARERSPLALILCDIDRFKQFNDAYGHLAGDDCLQRVASALNHCVNRPSDLVARFGGEEFAAVLPQTQLEGAIRVAERMQQAVARLQISHAQSFVHPHVTLSIGISCIIPDPNLSSEELIHSADRYLYLAKQRGRNQIIFSP